MAIGAAIAERFIATRFGEWAAHKTYAYISDGGIQEEVSQGVGRLAGHLGLNNLIMYYDANNIQLSTTVEEVDTEDIVAKYEAWGWRVISIDGHSEDEIREALKAANDEKERPTLIVGKTVMGKGAVGADGSSRENLVSTHGQPLSKAGVDVAATIKGLGGDPEDPFKVFPEAEELYAKRREELRAWAAEHKAVVEAWSKENPEEATKLEAFFSNKLPEIDYSTIKVGEGVATRVASAAVLGEYSEKVENMIVMSADLSNSDRTDGFLKHTHPIVKGDFTGRFLHMGVSELTMACVMNGMALHGGVIPVGGTFFVFSDYMKPAIRMSALMRLHVVFVWTHDSFRVGEDGPTHQPVEHEMQIRLLEHLRNHRGERSMVVLRPADSAEAISAWKIALEEERPVGLIFSRQNVDDVPAKGEPFRGGYDRDEARRLCCCRLRGYARRSDGCKWLGGFDADRWCCEVARGGYQDSRGFGTERGSVLRSVGGVSQRGSARGYCSLWSDFGSADDVADAGWFDGQDPRLGSLWLLGTVQGT